MDWIYSELWNGIKPILSNIVNRIKDRVKIKTISRCIREQILSEFGKESFYNDFDKYLSNNKVLSSFISQSVNSEFYDFDGIVAFTNKRIDAFIEEYPQYIPVKSQISLMLKKLFIISFNSLNKIEDKQINSAVNIIKEYVLELQNEISILSKQIELVDDKMKVVCELINEKVLNNDSLCVKISTAILTSSFFPPSLNGKYLCKRERIIADILQEQESVNWLHVVGSVWSGKTTTASLIKQRIKNSIWMDLSQGDPIGTIQTFKVIAEEYLKINQSGFTIIIDNLPMITTNQFKVLLSSTTKYIVDNNCKIVSFSNYQISELSVSDLDISYKSITLPDFSNEDVLELMKLMNMPKRLMSEKTSEFFLALSGKKPSAVLIVLHFLKSNGWNISNDTFQKILQLDIEGLSEQLNTILMSTVKDESTRELLYRISSIGHFVSRQEIDFLASVEPSISLVGEKIRALTGIWLICDNNNYMANGILRNISNDNIKLDIKKEIHKRIADSILSKKVLNQYDVNNLIVHFSVSGDINKAGQIYISAMQEMCINEYTQYDGLFLNLWRGMPLPAEMDIRIKTSIRFYQIWYDKIVGNKVNNDYISELNEYAKKDEFAKCLVFYAGIILLTADKEIGQSLIDTAEQYEFPKKSIFPDKEKIGIMSSTLSLRFCYLSNIDDINNWLSFAEKNLNSDIVKIIDNSDNRTVFTFGFEKIRSNLPLNDVENLSIVVQKVLKLAKCFSWTSLIVGCLKTLIRLEGNNKKDYENAKLMCNPYLKEDTTTEIKANVLYCIGLLASDYGKHKDTIEYLTKACNYRKVLKRWDLMFCCVNCSVAYFRLNMIMECKSAIEQALVIAKSGQSSNEEQDFEEELFKVHFERFFCYYLSNDTGSAIDSLQYMNEYLISHRVGGNEHYIGTTCHCLLYTLQDIVANKPPKKLGEEYASPYPGMIWNVTNSEGFINSNNTEKIVLINIMSALLFDFYNENELACKWLLYGLKNVGDDNHIYDYFPLSSFHVYKLFQLAEFGLACDMMCNTMNHFADSIMDCKGMAFLFLAKISVYFIKYPEEISKALPLLKNKEVLAPYDGIWKEWIEDLELFNREDPIFSEWIERSKAFSAENNGGSQMLSYLFATDTANIGQLVALYSNVFAYAQEGLTGDIYWVNKVLKPLVSRQITDLVKNNDKLYCQLEKQITRLSDYSYTINDIKELFRTITNMVGNWHFNEDTLKWIFS